MRCFFSKAIDRCNQHLDWSTLNVSQDPWFSLIPVVIDDLPYFETASKLEWIGKSPSTFDLMTLLRLFRYIRDST